MATIPEKMSEKDVRELAEKIASSYMQYMQGKDCSSAKFIEIFLDMREAAIAMINKREEEKIAFYHDNMRNLSFDDISEDLTKSVLR